MVSDIVSVHGTSVRKMSDLFTCVDRVFRQSTSIPTHVRAYPNVWFGETVAMTIPERRPMTCIRA